MKNCQNATNLNIQGSDSCWAGGTSACLTRWRYLHAQGFSEGKRLLQNTLKYKSEQTQFIKINLWFSRQASRSTMEPVMVRYESNSSGN